LNISTRNNKRFFEPVNHEPGLKGRTVLLGVTGGIAAYKAVELTRLLIKGGARVQVVMTEAGTKFVTPLTFEAITARRVFVKMFPDKGEPEPWHTELSTQCDLVVVAPASANHLAKLACGIADDLLTTTLLACEKPRVLCPAMNTRMWANPVTQDNLNTLKRRGYRIIPPEKGEMARPGEDEGVGRLAEPETIYNELKHILSAPQDLKSVKVLVTAGRTEESWDPVRVLTNRASGRMGFALAEEARERGANVLLIHGPTDVIPPSGVHKIAITTARQMTDAVMRELHSAQIVLMSAAVSDYTFEQTVEHKIKKGDPDPKIKLTPTTDILKTISHIKGDRIVVGFALETENVLENALKKLREKHLDIVVANNPLHAGSGFQHDTNQVFIIHRSGRVIDLPLQSKREIARAILDAVITLYRNPEPEPEPEPDIEMDIEVDDDMHGRVHLTGLDTSEEEASVEETTEVTTNGQTDHRPRGRRGGRRARRAKEKGGIKNQPVESQPKVPQPRTEVKEQISLPAIIEAPAVASEKPKSGRKRPKKSSGAKKMPLQAAAEPMKTPQPKPAQKLEEKQPAGKEVKPKSKGARPSRHKKPAKKAKSETSGKTAKEPEVK
jgi:phosphopantothenoylcysteine decarboxylase / phosphopantothenate---cysteine ligase